MGRRGLEEVGVVGIAVRVAVEAGNVVVGEGVHVRGRERIEGEVAVVVVVDVAFGEDSRCAVKTGRS